MSRIGIFPGTFDPVHAGHIAFAQAVLGQCRLDRVLFLPEALPRGKQQVAPLRHRLAMLQLALQDDDALQALTLSSRQFTIQDTLPELQARFPGERLVFLLGSDVVDTFRHRWPGLARLFAEVELAIGLREGSDKRSVDALFAELATTFGRARYRCLTSPRPGAASSRIRGATEPHAAEGLPEEVTEYMRRHRLYI